MNSSALDTNLQNIPGSNPLLIGMNRVEERVIRFKNAAREFFCSVVLSARRCPNCEGALRMTASSRCMCRDCGKEFDPTTEFQKSDCCSVRLVRRVCHYACAKCARVTPSRFLFDERLYTPEYFSEKVRESRQRERVKREEMRLFLASSRSGTLSITELPNIEAISGLEADLDKFVQAPGLVSVGEFQGGSNFHMQDYRQIIRAAIAEGEEFFTVMPALIDNIQLDTARRFITLLFMRQFGEVEITQYGNDILVKKHEVDEKRC